MKIIGLTGSIATGKSLVAAMLAKLGYPVHDADRVVHKCLGPYGQAVPQVIAHFGKDFGSLSEGINRQKLGDQVFQDKIARKTLEGIIHPLIFVDRKRFLFTLRSKMPRNIPKNIPRHGQMMAVLDMPLLFETGEDYLCDYIVTVWAPLRVIKMRALRRPGMNEGKLAAILHAQLPQSEKIRLADLALPTALGRAETHHRLIRWLARVNHL